MSTNKKEVTTISYCMCVVILLSSFSLFGCASAPVKEVINVPVPVFCKVNDPQKPALKYSPGTYNQLFPLVRDLKGDREQMIAYQLQLEAALKACK